MRKHDCPNSLLRRVYNAVFAKRCKFRTAGKWCSIRPVSPYVPKQTDKSPYKRLSRSWRLRACPRDQ